MSLALIKASDARVRPVDANTEPSVAILAPDPSVRSRLAAFFSARGLFVSEAASIDELVNVDGTDDADAVVVVSKQPDRRLRDRVQSLRAKGSNIAFILLSDVDDVFERVLAIEMGFDDIVSETCAPREILARIHRIVSLRSSTPSSLAGEPEATLPRDEAWLFNERQRTLTAPTGTVISLSRQNACVLNELIDLNEHSNGLGEATPRASVLNRSSMSRLRKRFKAGGIDVSPLLTVRGGSYVFCAKVKRVGLHHKPRLPNGDAPSDLGSDQSRGGSRDRFAAQPA